MNPEQSTTSAAAQTAAPKDAENEFSELDSAQLEELADQLVERLRWDLLRDMDREGRNA